MMILKLGSKDTTLGNVDKQENLLILNKKWYIYSITTNYRYNIMKRAMKLFTLLFLIGIISCTDKKKEEEETKAAIEQIETVESELEKVSEEVNQKVEELEDSLKDLDSI